MGVNKRLLNEGCVVQKIKKTQNHRYTSEQTRRSSMTTSVTEIIRTGKTSLDFACHVYLEYARIQDDVQESEWEILRQTLVNTRESAFYL